MIPGTPLFNVDSLIRGKTLGHGPIFPTTRVGRAVARGTVVVSDSFDEWEHAATPSAVIARNETAKYRWFVTRTVSPRRAIYDCDMPANAWRNGESPEDRKYARAARESQRRNPAGKQGSTDDRRTYVLAGGVLVVLLIAALLLRAI